MFERIKLANLPTFLAIVANMLRADGLFLNHGITHDEEGWQKSVSSELINCYVFPGGELISPISAQQLIIIAALSCWVSRPH